MYRGEIVEAGAVERIFAQPEHEYTRALLDAVPRLDSGGAGRMSAARSASRIAGKAPVLEVRDLSVMFPCAPRQCVPCRR